MSVGDAAESPCADAENEPSANDRLHQSLERIAAEQRDLLALHEIGGLTIAELAQLTGSARATVRERLARARAAVGRRISAPEWQQHPPAPQRTTRAAVTRMPAGEPVARAHELADDDIAVFGDTVVAIWSGAVSADGCERLGRVMGEAASAYPAGIAYLAVVDASAAIPTIAARAAIVRLVAGVGSGVKAAAYAVENRETRELVTAIVNSCTFLARSQLDSRFFDGLPTAASWLARYSTCADGPQLEAQAAALHARAHSH